MSFHYSPKIVTDGLVLCLDAANTRSYPGSGTVWTDISKSGLSGTLTNGPTFNSANGGSLVFDGTNDYVTLGTPAPLNGHQVPLTITSWAKLASSAGNRTLYSAYKNTNNSELYCMIRVDSGILKYYTSLSNGGWQAQGSLSIPLNVWNFFAVSVSGTIASPAITIYLNGVSQSFSLSAMSSTPSLIVDFRIGGSQTGYAEYWSGNVANLTVYKKTLSAAEIAQNYNATKKRFGL